MRIFIFLVLILSMAKPAITAAEETAEPITLSPVEVSEQKQVVLHHFSPDLLNAAADCLPYNEDFTAYNPDLKKISAKFGGAEYSINIDIKGISDNLCHFVVKSYLYGVGGTETSCKLNGEQHLALVKAINDRSLQPVTVAYVISNDENNEPPVQTTLTAGHFDAIWEQLKNTVCTTRIIEPPAAEKQQTHNMINRLSTSFQTALRNCTPTVEERKYLSVDNSITILGKENGKCHLFYNNFDLRLPTSSASQIKSYDELKDMLLDSEIASYRDKNNYSTRNLLFEIDYCRKHKAGRRNWLKKTTYNSSLEIENGLVSKFSDDTCRLKLVNKLTLDGKKIDYSLFCALEYDIINMILMSYEELLSQYGEKTLKDAAGNETYVAPQSNEKTRQADDKFLADLQRLHLCQTIE